MYTTKTIELYESMLLFCAIESISYKFPLGGLLGGGGGGVSFIYC